MSHLKIERWWHCWPVTREKGRSCWVALLGKTNTAHYPECTIPACWWQHYSFAVLFLNRCREGGQSSKKEEWGENTGESHTKTKLLKRGENLRLGSITSNPNETHWYIKAFGCNMTKRAMVTLPRRCKHYFCLAKSTYPLGSYAYHWVWSLLISSVLDVTMACSCNLPLGAKGLRSGQLGRKRERGCSWGNE